MEQSEQEKTYF